MTGSPVRIAVVGLGKIARTEHLPAIRGNSAFALAATVDLGSGGLEGVPHYASLSELLESASTAIDAVAICTPPQDRHQLATLALQHGLHVLLEKPPATSPADCEALVSLARDSNRSLLAAWHSRFAGGVEPAREWLSTRHVRRVSITWHESVAKWHPGQTWIWQDGGFGVFDAGINALSILTLLLPEPLTLGSAKLVKAENSTMPVAAELQISAGQIPVTASFDWRHSGSEIWNIEIDTNDGRLTLSEGGASLAIDGHQLSFENREYPALYARFQSLISSDDVECDCLPLKLVHEALTFGPEA